jgi:hypothetical protein
VCFVNCLHRDEANIRRAVGKWGEKRGGFTKGSTGVSERSREKRSCTVGVSLCSNPQTGGIWGSDFEGDISFCLFVHLNFV